MNGFNDFDLWRQPREELLREAALNRLARAAWSDRKKVRQYPAPDWELQRYGGRLHKFFRALRHTI